MEAESSTPGSSIAQVLPRSYAASDCFEGSNGKSRTLPAGFLWLPTNRCIAHGWGLLSSLWG